jgi:glycosyltransferase involved in cell wall biosynthesis
MEQMPGVSEGSALTASVVIPVKDDAVELRRCLAALGGQTRAADEIIVVDNESSDASAEVAARYGAIVVRCDERGIAAAASHGYDCATGDLILRLDADCVPGATWVQHVTDAFARRPDVAAFTGGARFIDGPAFLRAPLAAVYLAAYALAASAALGHLPLFGSNVALRRTAWRDIRSSVHRHDPDVHDDFDLTFHLGEHQRIRYLRGASMGMSMRPFADGSAFRRRLARGVHTVAVHWPRDFPPMRWRRLARGLGARA